MKPTKPNILRLDGDAVIALQQFNTINELAIYVFIRYAQAYTPQAKYSSKTLVKLLGVDREAIQNAIQNLICLGLVGWRKKKPGVALVFAIETKKKKQTTPPYRTPQQGYISPPKGGIIYIPFSLVVKTYTHQGLLIPTSPNDYKRTPQYKLAIRFFNAIPLKVKRRMNRLPKKVDRHRDFSAWAKEFAHVLNRNLYTAKEIQRAIDWYADHVLEPYTPKLYSARRFCDELWRVFESMERNQNNTQRQIGSPQPITTQSKLIHKKGRREVVELSYMDPEAPSSPYKP